MMIRIAIVDDDIEQQNALRSLLLQFGDNNSEQFDIIQFNNAVAFLENYSADYDIVFMDIRMPYLDGINAAKYLREKDENVIIIFITSLAQYAIKGYAVAALDYLVKPVKFADLNLTMVRALKN